MLGLGRRFRLVSSRLTVPSPARPAALPVRACIALATRANTARNRAEAKLTTWVALASGSVGSGPGGPESRFRIRDPRHATFFQFSLDRVSSTGSIPDSEVLREWRRGIRWKPPPTPGTHFPASFPQLRILLGSVLLVAAGLKAHALWTDPIPPLSLFSSPRWQLALLEVEALVGLWLVIGWSPLGAWLVGFVAFGLLGLVSLYLALLGESSCGCFGKVAVSPWVTFVGNVVAAATLWRWRPRAVSVLKAAGLHPGRIVLGVGYLLAGVIILAGGFLGLAYCLGHSPGTLLVVLRGESVTVEPTLSDLGSGVPGEKRSFQVQVTNHTERAIRHLGGTATCSCIAEGLPVTVPAKGSANITITARFVGPSGVRQEALHLYTDDDFHPVVITRYRREIVHSLESKGGRVAGSP